MASGSKHQSSADGADPTSHQSQVSPEGERVRTALMSAAIDLLAVQGHDGFSSRQVAKAAGVNDGLIH